MGCRAVITFNPSPVAVGVYLHWGGAPEFVLAALQECIDRGYRTPDSDPDYAMARLIGLLHEATGKGETGLGVDLNAILDTDNGDNGTYVIGGNWEILDRLHSACPIRKPEDLTGARREMYEDLRARFKTL